MRATLALLGFAGYVAAQAVTAAITPTGAPPAGCTGSVASPFEISIVAASSSSKRDGLEGRQDGSGQLQITLTNGVLHDSEGRTGYIASNFQFQFDSPPQAGAIYTAGFSLCSNNTLALGSSALWWSCSSGSSFDNIYDRDFQPSKCKPIYQEAIGASGGSGGSGSVSASSAASSAATPSTPSTAATPSSAAGGGSGGAASASIQPAPSAASGGSSGASATPPTISQGAAPALVIEAPQALLFGIVGALALF